MSKLADYTTLRVGGPAALLIRAETEAQLIAEIEAADASQEPVSYTHLTLPTIYSV